MTDPLFKFFENDRPPIDPESPEWKLISFKEYPRSQKIPLPPPLSLDGFTLEKALRDRKTTREFSSENLSQEKLSALLFWSAGLIHGSENEHLSRRSYPSGGARFPIETYLTLHRVRNLEKGVYHYHVQRHELEKITSADQEKIRNALPYEFAKDAPAVIFFSFVDERICPKYGTLGYKLGLLEGGHVGQNFYLLGAALHIGIAALGSIDYDTVEKELDLDDGESLFYHLAVGPPKDQKGCG